jgi:hypothetical protein
MGACQGLTQFILQTPDAWIFQISALNEFDAEFTILELFWSVRDCETEKSEIHKLKPVMHGP